MYCMHVITKIIKYTSINHQGDKCDGNGWASEDYKLKFDPNEVIE